MRINYTGKLNGLSNQQQEKLNVRFAKLSKLLDSPAEQRQAHVIVKADGRLTKAEITVHYYGHDVVGVASDSEPYSAMTEAAHKLETQILKLRKKWVDSKRHGASTSKSAPAEAAPVRPRAQAETVKKARLFRPRVAETSKPMTAEEAVAGLNKKTNYLLLRDSDGIAAALVVRRADGNFDLLELQ